jgi:hypothetical protein
MLSQNDIVASNGVLDIVSVGVRLAKVSNGSP